MERKHPGIINYNWADFCYFEVMWFNCKARDIGPRFEEVLQKVRPLGEGGWRKRRCVQQGVEGLPPISLFPDYKQDHIFMMIQGLELPLWCPFSWPLWNSLMVGWEAEVLYPPHLPFLACYKKSPDYNFTKKNWIWTSTLEIEIEWEDFLPFLQRVDNLVFIILIV